MAGQLRLVAIVGERWITNRDGDDLVVDPLLVAHAHDADGARLDDRQREDRLLAEDERVQRIPVIAIRAGNESVVGGVVDGAVEHAIEAQQARLLIELVLVLAALGDLDDDGEVTLDGGVVDVGVVPRMHAVWYVLSARSLGTA